VAQTRVFSTYNIVSASAFYPLHLQENQQNHPHFTRLKIRMSADPHFTVGSFLMGESSLGTVSLGTMSLNSVSFLLAQTTGVLR